MWQSVIVETKDQMMPPPSPQLLNSAASPPERIVGQWTYCGGGESTYIPPHNLYLPLLTILPNRSVMRGVLFTLQTREFTVSYFPIFNLGCGKKTMKQEILRRTLPVGLSVLFPLRHKMTKVPGPPCHIRYQTTKRLGSAGVISFFPNIGSAWSSLLCYWNDFPLFGFVKIAHPEPKLHWLEDRSIFEEPCSNK